MTDQTTTEPTAAIEVWARMLCAADAHVYGEHPTWQELSDGRRAEYRAAARWLFPRLTVTPPAPLPPVAQSPIREQLLNALDFSYCQALGFSPEGLLAAYEASRTQTVDPAALRDHAAEALAKSMHPDLASEVPPMDHPFWQTYRRHADAVLAAVLPATTNHDTDTSVPLSETERKMLDYALDLADEEVATDGSDFTDDEEDALAELRRIVTKPIATGTFELRGDTEIRAAALREAIALLDQRASSIDAFASSDFGEEARAVRELTDVANELRRAADETAATETEAAVDTVANRAAQVISGMGAEIRELRSQRDRYRTAWHSARGRTARAKDARDYWHYELRNADARILELERKLRPAAECPCAVLRTGPGRHLPECPNGPVAGARQDGAQR
ncbi:hypothetical protein ACFYWD_21215 [Streptomyces sp. NPDC003781]|uniref:hypothetical protein n=1 Tax=Streptomyces sp. NPDC003781 TaxID=3364686 RepID=UPI00367CE106